MSGKVRLKDIAEKTGVSVGTVSYVLNNANVTISKEVRDKVLAAANELKYTTNWAAKSLKMQHNNAIGVIVEDMRSWFISPLIDGISRYAEEADVRVLLCNLRVDSKTALLSHDDLYTYKTQIAQQVRNTFGNQVDALIYVGAFGRDVSNVYVPENDRIIYAYCYCGDSEKYASVYYNDYQGATLATEYLIANGHRRIAYLNGLPNTPPGDDRLNAFLNVMKAHGLPVPVDWAPKCEYGEKQMIEKLLLAPERPTAIFASMDSLCPLVYDVCTENGIRIPQDLSVISFDNSSLCQYIRPMLTSVSFPAEEIGYQAAKMICEEPNVAGRFLLDCVLMKRDSVMQLH